MGQVSLVHDRYSGFGVPRSWAFGRVLPGFAVHFLAHFAQYCGAANQSYAPFNLAPNSLGSSSELTGKRLRK